MITISDRKQAYHRHYSRIFSPVLKCDTNSSASPRVSNHLSSRSPVRTYLLYLKKFFAVRKKSFPTVEWTQRVSQIKGGLHCLKKNFHAKFSKILPLITGLSSISASALIMVLSLVRISFRRNSVPRKRIFSNFPHSQETIFFKNFPWKYYIFE